MCHISVLAYHVPVIQWIMLCQKNHMTTHVIIIWHEHVTSLCFLIEKMFIVQAIKSYSKGSYDKQNLTLVVISYEIYVTLQSLVSWISYKMITSERSPISWINYCFNQLTATLALNNYAMFTLTSIETYLIILSMVCCEWGKYKTLVRFSRDQSL